MTENPDDTTDGQPGEPGSASAPSPVPPPVPSPVTPSEPASRLEHPDTAEHGPRYAGGADALDDLFRARPAISGGPRPERDPWPAPPPELASGMSSAPGLPTGPGISGSPPPPPFPAASASNVVPPPMPPPPGYPGSSPAPGSGPFAPSPAAGDAYPAWLDLEFRPLNRLTTAFRALLAVPLWLAVWLLTPAITALLFFARVGVLFRRTYPDWAFAANAGFLSWHARTWAYALLLTDRFPSLNEAESQAVHTGYQQPTAGRPNRWNGVIWRSVVCLPHFVILGFLFMVAVPVATLLAWFAILATGRYPRELFNFVGGCVRWWFRVVAYILQLAEPFPPFSLAASAGPASSSTRVFSTIGGGVLAGLAVLGVTGLVIEASRPYVETVEYAALLDGDESPVIEWHGLTNDDTAELRILAVTDPADAQLAAISAGRRERLVVFELQIRNTGETSIDFEGGARLRVEYENDDGDMVSRAVRAEILTIANRSVPVRILDHARLPARAVFVIPADAEPKSLSLRFESLQREVRWDFE